MSALELLAAAQDFAAQAAVHAAVHVSNDDDNNGGWLALLAAGPAGAVAVWTTIFRYYRNTDKRNEYERETLVEAKPVTGSDQKVNEIRGTRNRRIEGENTADYRRRVRRIPSDPEAS